MDVEKPSNEFVSSEDLNPKWDDCLDDKEGAIKHGFVSYVFFNDTNMKPVGCVPETNGYVYKAFGNFGPTNQFPNDCTNDRFKKFCPKSCKACKEKWKAEYGGIEIDGVTLPSYNLTEADNGTFTLNLTDLSPEETLSTSYLTKLDLSKTPSLAVKKEFCVELHALSVKYSEPKRLDTFLGKEKNKVRV